MHVRLRVHVQGEGRLEKRDGEEEALFAFPSLTPAIRILPPRRMQCKQEAGRGNQSLQGNPFGAVVIISMHIQCPSGRECNGHIPLVQLMGNSAVEKVLS